MCKPVLIYDGECSFCRYWVGRCRHRVGAVVETMPSQAIGGRFPSIPRGDFARAVQYVAADGAVSSGAEAAFRYLNHAPWLHWPLRAYGSVPGFAPATERAYRFVAEHRRLFGMLSRSLWGTHFEPSAFFMARWLFLRNLGLVFFVAFWSFYGQIDGLIGENGILPAGDLLEAAEAQLGVSRFWRLPTLLWIGHSDFFLHLLCIAGMAASVLITLGVLVPLATGAAWGLYLSLVVGGQTFMSFQWDILLLETAFLAVFFAPFQLWPLGDQARAPSRIMRLLLWWLLFRLLFSSGLVKLDDPTWRNLAALFYHYETQPLPTTLGWFAHHLPDSFQRMSVFVMFVIELALPFFICLPRRPRHFAALAFIALQVLIMATGNYCFFNWVAIALCLLLFDDQSLRRMLPRAIERIVCPPDRTRVTPLHHHIVPALLAVLIAVLSGTVLTLRFAPNAAIPSTALSTYDALRPFALVNGYGLFAHMTTERPEIIVEGSRDGETWEPYTFKWKPGDIHRRPERVMPFQPRLDWQMWFAALSPSRARPWFTRFLARLLEGAPEVLALLEDNPFEDVPPRYVRAELYRYRFASQAHRRDLGQWWRREYIGPYFSPVALPSPPPQ